MQKTKVGMIRKSRSAGSRVSPMNFCLLNLILDKKIARKIPSWPAPASLLAQSCPKTEVISRIRNAPAFFAVKKAT